MSSGGAGSDQSLFPEGEGAPDGALPDGAGVGALPGEASGADADTRPGGTGAGALPDEVGAAAASVDTGPAALPEDATAVARPDSDQGAVPEMVIPPAEAVIPPPPPETPIPEGLLTPPPESVSAAESAVLPAPTTRRAERERPTPRILDGEQPAAVADDWAQRSIAPEAPDTGAYRVLAGAIFAFLIVLLLAAVGVGVLLLNTVGLPFAGVVDAVVPLPPRV